ncbi:MAG: 50S ribosomal protein L24 [Candidatus Aenigmarchaeota archaeon]|nr:50S ribosomal protein L24 [Candidatus Aenigmarchaeota archaeon]
MIRSKKPGKQRKFLFTAPLHLRRKLMAAHLSKELIKKYKTRSLPVRRGDEVEVMHGEFRNRRGKISRVDLKRYKVYIEGITTKRTDGTERLAPIHPSNLRIIKLNLDDKRRVKIIERRMKK